MKNPDPKQKRKFSPKQQLLIGIIETAWPDYHVIDLLGAGQFGVVFLAVREDPGSGIRTEEAIKIIDLRAENDESAADDLHLALEEYYALKKETELEEIRTLERLKGATHIIHISDYKVIESEDLTSCYILIRMDAMTSLQKILREHEEDSPAEAEQFAKKVGLDMCRALRHLQSAGGASTAHRDIKPDNILMSGNGDFYLADFGFARVLQSPGNLSYRGTQEYIAPEVETGQYDHRVDIYSLGLVLYRILNHGHLPFTPAWPAVLTRADIARADAQLRTPGRKVPAPNNCSKGFADIVCCMCAFDPDQRFRDAAAVENAILNLDRPPVAPAPAPAARTSTEQPLPQPEFIRPGKQTAAPSMAEKQPAAKQASVLSVKHILLIGAAAILCLLAVAGLRSVIGRKDKNENTGSVVSAIPAEETESSTEEASPAPASASAASDETVRAALTSMTMTENEQAYIREDVMNTLGMTFKEAVCIGGFGYKDCFARFYVEDFSRLTGSLSCPDNASNDASGILTIYTDDNENDPLFTAEVDRSMLMTVFDIDVSGAHFVTFRLEADSDFPQIMITDAVLSDGTAASAPISFDTTNISAKNASAKLTSLNIVASEQAYIREDVMNTLGMTFKEAVCIGGFGYKDCFARFYVEDFSRLTGSLSCPDNASNDASGTLMIYTDDNENDPLFTAEVDRSMLMTGFDIDVSGAHFVTFRLEADSDYPQIMITDAVLE